MMFSFLSREEKRRYFALIKRNKEENLDNHLFTKQKILEIKSNDFISKIVNIDKNLVHIKRFHNWRKPSIHHDIFLTGWILFISNFKNEEIGVRFGSQVISSKNSKAIFFPSFALIEWHIPKGIMHWEAFRFVENDNLSNKKVMLLDWPVDIKIKSKAQIVELIKGQEESNKVDYTESKNVVALQTKKYIDEHFSDEVTIPHISKILGFSHSTMTHYFKSEFGIPPKNYLNQLRLAKAASLIFNNNISATQACFESGYSDYSTFKSSFKSKYGVTPNHYIFKNKIIRSEQTSMNL